MARGLLRGMEIRLGKCEKPRTLPFLKYIQDEIKEEPISMVAVGGVSGAVFLIV